MRELISSLSMRTSIVSVLVMFCLMLLAGAGLGLLPLNAANQGFLSNTVHAERAANVQQTAIQLQHAQMALLAAERLQTSVVASHFSGRAISIQPEVSAQASGSASAIDSNINGSIEQLRQQYELARSSFTQFSEKATSVPQEFAALTRDITQNWQQSESAIDALIRSLNDSNWNAYASARRDYLLQSKALDAAVSAWLDASAQPTVLSAREARQTADSALARYRWVVIGVILGCIMATLLTLVTYIYLNHQVLHPVRLALAQIETTAQGDLTPPIQIVSRNELGQLSAGLQHMQGNLTRIVRTVRTGVEEIRVGAGEIASGNNDLSERTERQAAFIEQTTSSLAELSSRVLSNADSARMADQQTSNSMAVAQRGGAAMAQVVETMHDISDRSHKISEIVGVIDGIAFQTNILALNAAVEAARAGESGRGFAVVAGEVRTLAQKSAQAAREIKTLIAASTTAVEHGSKQVENAGETMQEIVASVGRVSDIMHEISAASSEQSKGIEQVNEAIAHMDQATQQNAALVEEAAAAASSLQEQAQQLFSAVEVFKINRPGEIVDSHASLRPPLLPAA